MQSSRGGNKAISPIMYIHWYTHYSDVIMDMVTSQITSLTIVYSTVYSGADLRIHHSSTSLAFVRGIQRGPVNSPRKWPVTRKMFPFDDVIMFLWCNKDLFHTISPVKIYIYVTIRTRFSLNQYGYLQISSYHGNFVVILIPLKFVPLGSNRHSFRLWITSIS